MHVTKPAFEQFRRTAMASGHGVRERDFGPIEDSIVASLDAFPDVLVEKVRRQPHSEMLLEISAKWLGPGAEASEVVKFLRRSWDDSVLGAASSAFHVLATDTAVVLGFAAVYEGGRFLTGRVKVTF